MGNKGHCLTVHSLLAIYTFVYPFMYHNRTSRTNILFNFSAQSSDTAYGHFFLRQNKGNGFSTNNVMAADPGGRAV